jgi:integrase
VDETTVQLGRDFPLRASVLLALNCGFGNHDVAALPLAALDLKAEWVNFPRPKTGIARRCPLWPETTAALREVIEARPATDSDLAFINSRVDRG